MSISRFLIIRLSSIGDVLHCTPVARALRNAMPSSHIAWVVGEGPADIVQSNPYLDEVLVWPREKWEKSLREGRFGEALSLWKQLSSALHNRTFDVALDVHGLFLSGMVAVASGAPRRIGLAHTRELNSWFMTETAPPVPADAHVTARYLSILRPLGIYSIEHRMTLVVQEEAHEYAEQFLRRRGLKEWRLLIALIPATTWPAKNWPPEYFATVANYLGQRFTVMLCGGPEDRAIADEILSRVKVPVIDAVGQTDLQQLAALMSQCDAVITGDTGPLHMAAALGIPTVSIFGPTDPRRFAPLSTEHISLAATRGCVQCSKHNCRYGKPSCMKAILPRQVLQALSRLIPLSSKGQMAPGRLIKTIK